MRLAHRMTYYTRTLSRQETGRYTNDTGDVLVITSAHAGLTNVSTMPVATVESHGGGRIGIHRATTPDDGQTGYVLKRAHREGELTRHGSKCGPDGDVTYYCPSEEWGNRLDTFCPSLQDARVLAGDAATVDAEREQLRSMQETATAAAASVDGETATAWSRAAYEAACTATGIDPADDATAGYIAGPGGGVYTIPEYHRDHLLWAWMARYRARGADAERAAAETTALQRAEDASGTGPYSRTAYENACAAAGCEPLDEKQLRNDMIPPRTSEVPATLDDRRRQGMSAELVEQRRAEREALPQGHVFATKEQVNTVMRLLARRARTGEGGGFFDGPADREGVANLSAEEASLYITSLQEDY